MSSLKIYADIRQKGPTAQQSVFHLLLTHSLLIFHDCYFNPFPHFSSPSSFYPTPLHLIIFPPTFQMWRPKFFHPSSFPFSFLRFLYQQFNPKFIFIFTNFYHLSLQKINFLTCAFVSVLTHL